MVPRAALLHGVNESAHAMIREGDLPKVVGQDALRLSMIERMAFAQVFLRHIARKRQLLRIIHRRELARRVERRVWRMEADHDAEWLVLWLLADGVCGKAGDETVVIVFHLRETRPR